MCKTIDQTSIDRLVNVENWKARWLTAAHLELLEIKEMAETLRERLQDWTDSHGSECGCPFCSDDADDAENMEYDLRGSEWALDILSGILRSNTIDLDEEQIAEARERIEDIDIDAPIPFWPVK